MNINALHTTSRCLFARATLIQCSERKSLERRNGMLSKCAEERAMHAVAQSRARSPHWDPVRLPLSPKLCAVDAKSRPRVVKHLQKALAQKRSKRVFYGERLRHPSPSWTFLLPDFGSPYSPNQRNDRRHAEA
jgi:hypothetical protein